MPLLNDFDLQNDHLLALSSRDQIAGLFARLGYNTNARLTQTAEAMGLTSSTIQREIKQGLNGKSLAGLRPIKVQLARTDALIDQIVYKLYGLTEGEIKVVEGKAA